MFTFCRQFCCPLPCTDFMMDVCCLAVQVGLAMVYLLWMSDGCYYYECDIGDGSGFLVAAQVFWILAACFTKCMRPSAWQRKKTAEKEAKEAEEAKEAKKADEDP
mmetsp:Transcript_8293/g.19972  ORF Transcript_8293/g.19972 Transcript_8293/m.19972 type:complete len:105 (-) Transcript_8293:200-514(-)